MKKKIVAIMMMAVLALSTAACGADGGNNGGGTQAGNTGGGTSTSTVANKDKPLVWFNRQPSNSSTGELDMTALNFNKDTYYVGFDANQGAELQGTMVKDYIEKNIDKIDRNGDGVIAPLFYMFLFGPVGAWVYKAINTMDSMLGYKNDKYRYFGTCAARVDDVVNFIPARLSAWLMVGAAGILGMDIAGAARIHLRDRRNHASPNSAQTESACAGALGLQLAGNAYYFGKLYEKPTIGDAKRQIEPKDIRRANRLMYGTAVLMVIVGVGVLIGCGCFI